MDDNKTKLTVAEFRKNVKSALDFCVEGGVVEINRMGQRFMLTMIPRDTEVLVGASKPKINVATEAPAAKSYKPQPKNPRNR